MRGHTNYCSFGLQALLFMMCLSTIAPPSLSEAKNAEQKPSIALVGTIYCDTKPSHFISGATVFVKCNEGAFKTVLKTNKRGNFKLPLKSSVEVKACHVSLLKRNDPHCATSSIRHIIKQQGTSSHVSNNQVGSQKNLLGPITSGPFRGLGPIMQPVIPPFLGLPNPFQPPSFGFPGGVPGSPNPFQPPSVGFPGGVPGSLNPFQPPSSPSFGFPGGVPGFSGLTPSPPAFPAPFPPGIPDSASKTSP